MRNEIKILLIWIFSLILLRVSLSLFPHLYFNDIRFINTAASLILFLLSVVIAHKSHGSQKFVFWNLAVYFGSVVPLMLATFVGKAFLTEDLYSNFYYRLYVNKIAGGLVLLFPVLFVLIDFLLNKKRVWLQYLLSSIVIVALFFIFYSDYAFHPFLLHDEKEYVALIKVEKASREMAKTQGRQATDQELVQVITDSCMVDHSEAFQLLQAVKPYLEEGGNIIIFWKPLTTISIYINAIALVCIVAFLALNYVSRRPSSSYTDKIMIFLGIMAFMEMLHSYGTLHTTSLPQYRDFFDAGQYFTIVVSVMLVYTLDLKMRFTFSPAGIFYEKAIQRNPSKVTIWKDEFDKLILSSFFKPEESFGKIATLAEHQSNERDDDGHQ